MISSACNSSSTCTTRSRKRASSRRAPAVVAGIARGQSFEFAQRRLRAANARDARAFMAKQELRIGPALVLFADAVLHGNLDVLEPDLVHFMLPVEHDDRSHGDAGRLHVDQQERDAFLLACVGVGAHEAEVANFRAEIRLLRGKDQVHALLSRRVGNSALQNGDPQIGTAHKLLLQPAELVEAVPGLMALHRLPRQATIIPWFPKCCSALRNAGMPSALAAVVVSPAGAVSVTSPRGASSP